MKNLLFVFLFLLGSFTQLSAQKINFEENKNDLVQKYDVLLFKGQLFNGETVSRYVNGEGYGSNQVKKITPYKDGKKHGTQLSYYESGQLAQKRPYKDGEKHGERLKYYENGQLKSKENYIDGAQKGKTLYYDENGQLEG
tara:strand:- start:241 stop:660 length:420 start_codon:yes stop_codon:yes gene_type:complete